MVFFQFKPSPPPNDVYVCTPENTPRLTTTKTLLIISLLLGFLMPVLSIITFAFAFFYLSKLSLRMRLFKLFTLGTIIQILFSFALLMVASSLGANSASFGELGFAVFIALSALSVIFYLQWQLHKELSFITHEPLFFMAIKFVIIGVAVALAFVVLGVAFQLVIQNIFRSVVLVGASLAGLFFLAGFVAYVMAIFRFRFIVAYGENPQPLSNHYS